MAAYIITLGGGRSTLANQGTLRVIEATPPGYYRAYTKRRSQKLPAAYRLDIQLRVAPCVNYTIPLHLLRR